MASAAVSAVTAVTPARASALRARRRMLGTLLFITLGAGALAAFRLTEAWVVIPPGLILGIFLLLLRECAGSDAARARRLARAAVVASQADGVARPDRRAGQPRRAVAAAGASSAVAAGAASAEAGVAAPDEMLEPVAESGRTAQIIDLTARARDQLYDQYEDAAARAVGD